MGPVFKSRKRIQDGTLTLSGEERDWVRELYLGEVRYVDANVGRLLEHLKRLRIYKQSLIVLTSDHGEEFWDHDRFEHGHTLYDELLSVPLVVKLPNSTRSKRIDSTVPTQAVTPTVLELCGVDFNPSHLDARSLSPLWGPNTDSYETRPLFASGVLYYEDREAVYFDGLKFIRSRVTGRAELFDRDADPDERLSIVRDQPDVVLHAGSLLRDHTDDAADKRKMYGITQIEFAPDEETLKRLKSLGYM
jgi:arylsulfatase A-like enzyme